MLVPLRMPYAYLLRYLLIYLLDALQEEFVGLSVSKTSTRTLNKKKDPSILSQPGSPSSPTKPAGIWAHPTRV